MKSPAIRQNIVFLLILMVSAFRLQAQGLSATELSKRVYENSGTPIWEDIYLHIDRDKYISGEDIWFSVYSFERKTGKLSNSSAVAYIEVLNPWNMPLKQARIQLSGGRGNGSFSLPDSISSGTYTIRAYTNWMKNFLPNNCFRHDIEVYNPFKNSDFWRKIDSVKSFDQKLIHPPGQNGIYADLRTDDNYKRREKVSIKVSISSDNTDRSGSPEMSISVVPSEVSSKCQWMENYSVPEAVPQLYRFESDGHYLSGKIKYKGDTISDSSDFLFLSVQGKVAEFDYAQLDNAGRFTFVLPVDSKMRNLILQPENANNNMTLEIEPSFSWKLPASYTLRDTLSDTLLEVFSRLSFNYQAEKIYGIKSKKEPEPNDSINLKRRRFYGIPEMEIILDDYIKLPSMEEVFIELLPGVILRSKKNGYEIKITNPLTGNFYDEQPLVMIDGVIINDLMVVVNLDPETVEKIEVVKTPYLIGDLILHGIVNIITRTGDFSSIAMPEYAVILPYRVIDKSCTFYAPDYSDEKQRMSRRPDLRNTLYWNPSVKTNRNGEAYIEFWTSDLPGIYTIKIQGISGTGEKVSLNKSFMVRY